MIIEIVLARILVPEIFGVMAILLVLINVADVIAQSGLGTALIQRQDVTDISYSTAFWLSLALAAVLYIVIWIAAPFIASFYNMGELDVFLRATALGLFLKAYNSIQRSFLQKNMEFRTLFIANTTAVVVSGLVGVGFAALGFGIWALIAQNLLQAFLTCLIMFWMIPWHPSIAFSGREAKQLFAYGWKICVSGIFGKLYTGLSELIIGKACGATQLGYYSNGAKWPNAGMSAFSNAIENVLFPAFSKISSNIQVLRENVEKAIVVGTYVMVFVSFLLILTAEPLVALLLTEKWLPCVPVFQLTCLSCSFYMLQIAVLRAYMAIGDSGLYMKLQIIKVSLGAIVIGVVAVVTANIYLVAVATVLDTIFNIFVVDLQPAKKRLELTRWKCIQLIAPYFALGIGATCVSLAVALLDLPYLATFLLELTIYSMLFVGASKLLGLRGFKECVSAVQSLRSPKRS